MNDAEVWIVAGGTAGHLHAGIELARSLEHLTQPVLVTGDRPVEDRAAEGSPWPRVRLADAGLVRPGHWPHPRALATNLQALRRVPVPRIAVGLGGAHEVLALGFAKARGARLVGIEQNAALGRAHRLLAPWLDTLVLAWPTTVPRSVQDRSVLVGAPARKLPSRSEARRELGVSDEELVLVVTSGSLGARSINDATVELVTGGVLDGLAVFHFLGERNLPSAVPPASERYRPVVGFDPRAGAAIAAADLVLARAGSSTLAELALAGVPSVLVPLPGAPGDHQRANARLFEQAGAALIVEEGPGLAARVRAALVGLVADPARRAAMGEAARSLGSPRASERIVEEVVRWLT